MQDGFYHCFIEILMQICGRAEVRPALAACAQSISNMLVACAGPGPEPCVKSAEVCKPTLHMSHMRFSCVKSLDVSPLSAAGFLDPQNIRSQHCSHQHRSLEGSAAGPVSVDVRRASVPDQLHLPSPGTRDDATCNANSGVLAQADSGCLFARARSHGHHRICSDGPRLKQKSNGMLGRRRSRAHGSKKSSSSSRSRPCKEQSAYTQPCGGIQLSTLPNPDHTVHFCPDKETLGALHMVLPRHPYFHL